VRFDEGLLVGDTVGVAVSVIGLLGFDDGGAEGEILGELVGSRVVQASTYSQTPLYH